MQLTIISGRSGSGKSVALKVLEDLGYYCVDNMPLTLLPAFLMTQQSESLAVSIDIRNLASTSDNITTTLTALKDQYDVNVFFLDADENEIIKRYSETRRRHPLSKNNLSLQQAIEKENNLLFSLRCAADKVINTSQLSIHNLSEHLHKLVMGKTTQKLVIVVESFGFKYGIPSDADYVFDVRFLPNPHWEPELRQLTGLDLSVQTFLENEELVIKLKTQLIDFFNTWLHELEQNNRSYVTIAIGCTGGQHRSVYLAQQLGEYFLAQEQNVQIRHRTLENKMP